MKATKGEDEGKKAAQKKKAPVEDTSSDVKYHHFSYLLLRTLKVHLKMKLQSKSKLLAREVEETLMSAMEKLLESKLRPVRSKRLLPRRLQFQVRIPLTHLIQTTNLKRRLQPRLL